MVEYKEEEAWRCTYCNKKYKKYEDAVDCSTECCMMDFPSIDSFEVFICEFCKKEFYDEEEAESCENQHNMQGIKEASENINQRRLFASEGEKVK